ncbi:MAG: HlyD family type I secretion periplasmic adaptor subunit [Magnetospirillum sp.]|nr:HlyD family type I secretion periplasmic adaptor subunit [Magnetospirillum sp.]
MSSQSLANVPPASPQVPVPAAATGRSPVKQSSRQTRHLAQAIQLEESGTAPLVRFTMLLACVACLCFVAWAAVTRVDEVAIADGTVVPTGSLQTVQHLEGGIVEAIVVKDGDLVAEGAPLVKLSPAGALADLEQTRAREATLLLRAERLRAFAEGRKPDFTFIGSNYERLVTDNQAIYHTQIQARNAARSVIMAQLEQKRSDLALLEAQHKTMQDQIDVLSEELRMREQLVAKNLISRVVYLDNKRELARMKGELSRMIGQTVTARESMSEVENRLVDQQTTLHKQTMDEMGTVVAELAQVQESIARLEDRVNRLVITSPAHGYVKGMMVHNTGAVIAPGAIVCEVVPVDRELKLDARINTRDVGHIKPGQPVRIKVTTFDFARYGAVTGKLQSVSASSFLDEKGLPYFKGSVTLDKDYVGDTPGRFAISPGMTASIEIITGDKTLLQYMLKPIFSQLQESFHER